MGTLGGFASPFGPPPAASSPLASLGLAKPFGPPPATPPRSLRSASRDGTPPARAREARGGRGGLSVPKAGGLPTRSYFFLIEIRLISKTNMPAGMPGCGGGSP
jgi:hypothetical protein